MQLMPKGIRVNAVARESGPILHYHSPRAKATTQLDPYIHHCNLPVEAASKWKVGVLETFPFTEELHNQLRWVCVFFLK